MKVTQNDLVLLIQRMNRFCPHNHGKYELGFGSNGTYKLLVRKNDTNKTFDLFGTNETMSASLLFEKINSFTYSLTLLSENMLTIKKPFNKVLETFNT